MANTVARQSSLILDIYIMILVTYMYLNTNTYIELITLEYKYMYANRLTQVEQSPKY